MKNINILLFIFILFIPSLFLAQETQTYLVAIETKNQNELQLLEEGRINYYYQHFQKYISPLNTEQLNYLSENNIDYQILDNNPRNKNYFLFSPRKGKTLNGPEGELYKISNELSLIVHSDEMLPLNIAGEYNTASMIKIPKLIENSAIINNFSTHLETDSLITRVVDDINPDSVRYFIQNLQDFETRFLFASNRGAIAGWIKSEFERMGYTEVKIDSFWYSETWQKNVVATLPGENSDIITVVGGHHDSYSREEPWTYAPGADDNASGTSAVLELARVFKKNQVVPKVTIKFVTFAAEEYGLHGSKYYAKKLFEAGSKIKFMINHDMISHTGRPVDQSYVDINYYTGSEDFTEMAVNSANKYSRLKPNIGSSNSSGSDSHSFWSYGFPSVYFEERDFSPYYHSPSDVIENYNMDYCAEVIKASAATLLTGIKTPMRVNNFAIQDAGDGESLYLSWDPNIETDVIGYKIQLGKSTGAYDTEYTTASNSYLVNGLSDGEEYFIGISSYNSDEYQSLITEKYFIPRSIPLSPSGLTDSPQKQSIDLNWSENLELDLLGYNIYRSDSQIGEKIKLNTNLLTENHYLDENIENARYYYYTVAAVDSSQKESPKSELVRSMGISLDQGILLIDETSDGDGTSANPSDDEVDNFYKNLVSDFDFAEIDTEIIKDIKLADLGSYSLIILYDNDYKSFSNISDIDKNLSKYLEFGGKLIYTGFMPSKELMGNLQYPRQLYPGDFLYDYFKIKKIHKKFGSRFAGAIPVAEQYFPVYIDSTKTNPNNLYHLSNIEGFETTAEGNSIYRYDTFFDSSTQQGSMKDLAVGVEYSSSVYKSVILSFPLYFMDSDEAKDLLKYIINERFSEISLATRTNMIPQKYLLYQNYPNPFNPATKIKYEIPNTLNVRTGVDPRESSLNSNFIGRHLSLPQMHVNLVIYDILGREITTLVDKFQSPGQYEIEFNGTGLSSGIYFYRLQVGGPSTGSGQGFVETKKMMLIK